MVLIADDNIPRGKWPLGRVLKVFPGRDGRVRTAEVKAKDTVTLRARYESSASWRAAKTKGKSMRRLADDSLNPLVSHRGPGC